MWQCQQKKRIVDWQESKCPSFIRYSQVVVGSSACCLAKRKQLITKYSNLFSIGRHQNVHILYFQVEGISYNSFLRLEGVFMRCLLNIWGVMLFLRLTWVIGQAGLIEGLLVIGLCNFVTIVTG